MTQHMRTNRAVHAQAVTVQVVMNTGVLFLYAATGTLIVCLHFVNKAHGVLNATNLLGCAAAFTLAMVGASRTAGSLVAIGEERARSWCVLIHL